MPLLANHSRPSRIRDSAFLREATSKAEDSDGPEVVIDFAEVATIRSEEISDLIRLRSSLRNRGRTLVLENVRESVMQVFLVTRLDRLLDLR